MTIESPTHYEGTMEMIRRLNGLIEYSRAANSASDFATIERELTGRIVALQEAADEWIQSQSVDLNACESFTFCSSTENEMAIVRGGPPPSIRQIDFVAAPRPAQTAGLLFAHHLFAF